MFKKTETDTLICGDFLAVNNTNAQNNRVKIYFLQMLILLFQALWATGLRSADPRLSELMQNLQKIQHELGREAHGNIENMRLTRDEFKT